MCKEAYKKRLLELMKGRKNGLVNNGLRKKKTNWQKRTEFKKKPTGTQQIKGRNIS
jgi:hypothetical protein